MHLILPEIEDSEQILDAHYQYRKLWRQEMGVECPLLHAVKCNQSKCAKPNCDERKKMLEQHAERMMVCKRNVGEVCCNDCAIIERATVDHATFCRLIDCPVPKCNKIKAQKLLMRKIRQNQRNVVARKRQKSNQDYSESSSDTDIEDYEDGYYVYESNHVGLQQGQQFPSEEDSEDEDEHGESMMHDRNNNESQEGKRALLITEIINAVYKTNFNEWRSMMDNNDNKARSRVMKKLLDAFNEAGVLNHFPQDTSDEEIYSDEYDGYE
ncbi:uncharacterized protein LOC135941130 [Cloeon dipterum]|uniref:uncharacterized protein LOC135941130 n=1 Tax=Cloeon dipterum TaxID=197152 RepID=UPI00321FB107